MADSIPVRAPSMEGGQYCAFEPVTYLSVTPAGLIGSREVCKPLVMDWE